MRRLALPFLALLATAAALAAGCGGGEGDAAPTEPASTGTTEGATSGAADEGGDPRRDGLEIALGEWALTPEASAIRPGRVTFVVVNRGTMPHGFEIEREGDDSSGSGSGRDRGKVETRVLDPGESVRVSLRLEEGVYKLECNVDGHDDLGMEALLEVRRDAPLAQGQGEAEAGAVQVDVRGFAFAPQRVEVAAGQKVVWENHDPAEHTVTAEEDGFDSGTMPAGTRYERTFDDPGEYRYICALHPEMRGTVVVRR